MRNNNDTWGHDPSVKKMRKVFSKMEETHNILLSQIKLSFFDNRLRDIRETARRLFDQAVVRTHPKDLSLDEKTMIGIYKDALIQALRRADIPVTTECIGDDKDVANFITKV